jgi:hypothetical protein
MKLTAGKRLMDAFERGELDEQVYWRLCREDICELLCSIGGQELVKKAERYMAGIMADEADEDEAQTITTQMETC